MPEIIPAADNVSRLMFEPAMRKLDKEIYWENTFMFKTENGQCESLVWRKYASGIDDVHGHGCEKQKTDRARGRTRTIYFGAITANVGQILGLRSAKGVSFAITHVPDEGIHHAHIQFVGASTKADRAELKFLLKKEFCALEPHTCPEPASADMAA